jgi:hypothetical protein
LLLDYFSTELDEIKFVDKVQMKSDLKDYKASISIPKLDLSMNCTKSNKKKNNSYFDNSNYVTNDFSKFTQNFNSIKPNENKETPQKPKIINNLMNRTKLIQNMKMKKKLKETNSNFNVVDLLKNPKFQISYAIVTDNIIKQN